MKLRVKGNSIRYRLSKSDVSRFLENGQISEEVNFGNSSLFYELTITHNDQLYATFTNQTITVFMPLQMASGWDKTEQVGFSGSFNNLNILIEKDFQCIDNNLEYQSDNYPNPLLNC